LRCSGADDLFVEALHLKLAAGNEILRFMLGMNASSPDDDSQIAAAELRVRANHRNPSRAGIRG
jgi:hypothetical protein